MKLNKLISMCLALIFALSCAFTANAKAKVTVANPNIKSITEKLICDLKQEIKNIINEDNFSIIEIKKGSLQVLLTLQFIIFNEIQKLDTPNEGNETFDYFKFLDKFSETIRIEVKKIVKVLLESDFISMGMVKPDYVEENIFDMKNYKHYPFVLKNVNESTIETNSSIS